MTLTDKLREGRTTSRTIFCCGLGLLVLGVLSWFKVPAYEKGAYLVLFAFSNAFSGVLGFKFGITSPGMPSDTPVQQGNSQVTCPKCGVKFDLKDVS